jgi:hypothetical protein
MRGGRARSHDMYRGHKGEGVVMHVRATHMCRHVDSETWFLNKDYARQEMS